jgi:hypothetical protein
MLQQPISHHSGDFVSRPHAKVGIYTLWLAYNLARSESFCPLEVVMDVGVHLIDIDVDRRTGSHYRLFRCQTK